MADAPLVAGDSVLVAQIEVRRTAAGAGWLPRLDTMSALIIQIAFELIACFLE